MGGGGEGEAESEGWRRESGGSNATSDAEMEEDEGEHAPLTASKRGKQEIRARGLRGDARAGGSGGRKCTSVTANGGRMRGRHGARKENGGEREATGVGKV